MVIRARGLIVGLCVALGLVELIAFIGLFAGGVAVPLVAGAIVLAIVLLVIRLTRVGLILNPQEVIVRDLGWTLRFERGEVLGLAVQPTPYFNLRRIVVVCADGRVIPSVWTLGGAADLQWANRAAWAGYGFGPTQPHVAETLEASGRLASSESLPVATADPGLTPETVRPIKDPDGAGRWLGWEMVFMMTAFALPAIAGAVTILAEHLGDVSDLNEFDLPLPHHAGVSLFLLLFGYATSALTVPIALLLLARTGQPPPSLGLTRKGIAKDTVSAVGLFALIWVVNVALLITFGWLIDNKHLSNTATNSHVPAYYLVYAIFLSATTAINEEVLVNGYFLTRLSQRGWSPGRAFSLSLALRTSYHAYYGVGLILTVPLGFIVTRSFQKRQRLSRAILVHFINDAILLTIAVLTS